MAGKISLAVDAKRLPMEHEQTEGGGIILHLPVEVSLYISDGTNPEMMKETVRFIIKDETVVRIMKCVLRQEETAE
ncbi:MAG TPA: hypothetical protein PLC05_02645 [bacterium]|nr:hypothetical protein [bacterium]HOR57205.1 hypothetical protein [bacterium]HPL56378.1 hypothetical protein [bacterium]